MTQAMPEERKAAVAPALEVQKLAVVNNGAYVMSFGLEIGVEIFVGGGITWLPLDWDSGAYSVGGSSVKDPMDFGNLPEGTPIRPQVRVRGGGAASASTYIRYAKNGQTATWEATGTTFDIDIRQLGVQ